MNILKTLRGEIEVIGYKNGKMFHYDKGDNTVTIYAKHSTMHCLTGESFTSHGTQRSFVNADHSETIPGEGVNSDGTLISGEQFFTNYANFGIDDKWSKSTVTASTIEGDVTSNSTDIKHSFFPAKMLFGTGFEFENWAEIGSILQNYQTQYGTEGWTSANFDELIPDDSNDYSAEWDGGSNDLIQKRSMNDILSGKLTTPPITDEDFGIKGAIKNGDYTESSTQKASYITTDGINELLVQERRGIGKPCFVYPKRENRFFAAGSEAQLSSDNYIENKLTLSVTLPEQTGASTGIFYPYNGYTLKEAGLFTDARMVLNNTAPTLGQGDYEHYNKMPYGMLFAKRYITPITKDANISISIRWTLYL